MVDHFRKHLWVLKKLKIELPYDQPIPLLGIYLREISIKLNLCFDDIYTYICTSFPSDILYSKRSHIRSRDCLHLLPCILSLFQCEIGISQKWCYLLIVSGWWQMNSFDHVPDNFYFNHLTQKSLLAFSLKLSAVLFEIHTWKWKLLSTFWLFVTPWTIQSMEFSTPEYWSESLSVLFDSLRPQGLYTIYGILHVRILEWVAFPFSRGSCQPRDRTLVSCIAGWFFTSWATREAQEYWSG